MFKPLVIGGHKYNPSLDGVQKLASVFDVPIELWREIESEKKTAYLLKSENMIKRLLEAKDRKEGIPFDEASKKLGI